VAARLAETWRKSAFVVAVEGDEGTGSARGWGSDNVSRLLAGSSECLVRYGGHGSAAGFTVRLDRLEDLRAALAGVYEERSEERPPQPDPSFHRIQAAEVMDAWRALGILDPFGPGNPEPRLGLEGLRARGSRVVHDRHLIWDVEMDGGQPLSVIAWDGLRRSLGPDALRPSCMVVGRLVPEQRPGATPFYLSVEAIF
jgi:single-stranded-DNA-specific exonuclease